MDSFEIGFVGLGAMGQAIVSRLLKAGHRLTVYDVSDGAIKVAVESGALGASSLKQLGASKKLVF
ncbi:MAG: NAD(P)-binding domain-containing protein, partial [Cycloclasticus sp.]|nr:NAD(P)-binding domain-containing protein [Cycloclasticus sp.]MBQ0790194.1 NAD(P)-binding domain-containing protein [Cycloclasticus sp.]